MPLEVGSLLLNHNETVNAPEIARVGEGRIFRIRGAVED